MGFFTDLKSLDCSPASMVATVSHDVEIDPRINPDSRYPAALNTPLDQIPLTLADLERLSHEIDAAIKEIRGFSQQDFEGVAI